MISAGAYALCQAGLPRIFLRDNLVLIQVRNVEALALPGAQYLSFPEQNDDKNNEGDDNDGDNDEDSKH